MSYMSGIRAQVFDIIVRQAMAGAPWRQICVGPMQVNNILPEEIETEIDRRMNLGRDLLSVAEQTAQTEYIERWAEIINTGDVAAEADLEKLIADLYRSFDLRSPKVVFCESPAQLVFYLFVSLHGQVERRIQSDRSKSIMDFALDVAEKLARDQTESFGGFLMEKLKELSPDQIERKGNALRGTIQTHYSNVCAPALAKHKTEGLDRDFSMYFQTGFKIDVDRILRATRTAFDVTVNTIPINELSRDTLQLLENLREDRSESWKVIPETVRDSLGHPDDSDQLLSGEILRANMWNLWQPAQLLEFGFVQEHLSERIQFPQDMNEELKLLLSLFRAAPWYSFFENICFVGKYPKNIVLDEQLRLSSRAGAAITYGDGYEVFAVDGITASRILIEHPESITTTVIDNEVNVAIRRMMIDTYGMVRYLTDSKARVIHKDEYGELYQKLLPGDESLTMVCVTNSTMEADGTYRKYFLRVPPNLTTARAAVAWTFWLGDSQYNPSVET